MLHNIIFNGLFVELGLAGHSHSYAQCFGEYWDSCKGYYKIFSIELPEKSKMMKLLCYQDLHGCHSEGWGETFLKISALVVGGRSVWQVQVTKEMLAAAFLSTLLLHRG